ncbi:MFS transporter [Leptolyngbya cf. ectocarpi LEGE 11479]|uniref:MFS transporter n=1 Tax=Leptolyngbya cf. ectocarpi LEGE 11479 TaxID=1828722 RepID=A0A928ZUS8_LEPEC|nr:MFS transporter [Leptolyngbya ectocarpi]MBE9067862.1 MFS transporter [Leptolyngbya cf. ectocarpi LEGE 11479]
MLAWLPQLRREIWILSTGQLLLYIGQGFTLVYASIYFVNELGFSPTQVGLALSSSGLAGIVGRFWSAYAIDSDFWGRRRTLMLSATITALACFCLAFANTFVLLVLGNTFLGLGVSLYWPANLSVITDLTTAENRAEAFALTRLVDNLGLALGALLAGQYVAMSGNYSILFILKGLTYFLFAGVIYGAIEETKQPQTEARDLWKDGGQALRDRNLLTFLSANLIFTIYFAQYSSTLPLYLANFIPHGNTDTGFSEQWISYFFVWHVVLKIVFQLPITRLVKAINHVSILLVALTIWSGAFFLLWLIGVTTTGTLLITIGAFSLIALAEILYSPAGISLLGEMSPSNLRGIYFSLESQCWSIGFTIGPALGGWALDHPDTVGTNLWLYLITGGFISSLILVLLRQQMTIANEPDLAADSP